MCSIALTTNVHSTVFALLPTELIYEVFEHAAALDTSTALVLSLVSSWVRRATEPLLYNTVVLSSARALRTFLLALSHKDPTFARIHVKHLGIFAQGPIQCIDKVLQACTGVESIASGFPLPSYRQIQGTVQVPCFLKEQHLLGLSCRNTWGTFLVKSTVTHLRVQLPTSEPSSFPLPVSDADAEEGEESGLEYLAHLPALTHLALVYRPPASGIATSIIPYLQRLLVLPSTQRGMRVRPTSMPSSSVRLVLIQVTGVSSRQSAAVDAMNDAALAAGGQALRIVAERAPLSAATQWEKAVRSGSSVWEEAEKVVKHRMKVGQM